jgi:hypothetical protein
MAKTYQVTVIQKYTAEMNCTITVKSDLDYNVPLCQDQFR